jgi:hypothetical protein
MALMQDQEAKVIWNNVTAETRETQRNELVRIKTAGRAAAMFRASLLRKHLKSVRKITTYDLTFSQLNI